MSISLAVFARWRVPSLLSRSRRNRTVPCRCRTSKYNPKSLQPTGAVTFLPLADLRRIGVAFVCAVLLCATAAPARQAQADRQSIVLAGLRRIDELVLHAVKQKNLPGAVVLVGHRGRIVHRAAVGNRAL